MYFREPGGTNIAKEKRHCSFCDCKVDLSHIIGILKRYVLDCCVLHLVQGKGVCSDHSFTPDKVSRRHCLISTAHIQIRSSLHSLARIGGWAQLRGAPNTEDD